MKREQRKERNMTIKWLRGAILELLGITGPNPINAEAIWLMLDARDYSITDTEYLQHLAYLEERGYVEMKGQRVNGLAKLMLKLTAKGDQLLRGFIEDDPGVEV